MEINPKLKSLYKHWEKHTVKPHYFFSKGINKPIYSSIINFCNERMAVYANKEHGLSRPYSKDPILNTYRFCNIYRELDRQTIFYHELLKQYEDNFPLWLLNMAFCRFICNTNTISETGLLNYDSANNKIVYDKLIHKQSPKYGNAYIFPISVIQKSEYSTREKFFCKFLPQKIPDICKKIEKFNERAVTKALKEILLIFGYNFKFHWTEILIDVAYQYPDKINLFDRFPIGPGSESTMKKLDPSKESELTCLNLVHSLPNNFDYLTFNNKKVYLSAENWEGIGCEYRKYFNLSHGSGRKRIYKQDNEHNS